MNWQNIPDGYEFRVYVAQTYFGAKCVSTIACGLESKEFDKIYQILVNLAEGIEQNIGGYTDDVAAYIADKTGFEQAEIMELIDPLVRSDFKYEDNIALIAGIEVLRFEQGKVQKINL